LFVLNRKELKVKIFRSPDSNDDVYANRTSNGNGSGYAGRTSNGNGMSYPSRSISSAVSDAAIRATGILALMGLAVIHIVQLVPTFQQTPLLGAGYVVLIVGAIAVGGRLLSARKSGMQLWLPVAGVAAAALGGYVFTRLLSTPLDNQDVGNWACMLGLAALFVEGVLLALSGYAMSLAPRHRRAESAPAQILVPRRASEGVRSRSMNGSSNLTSR
jgi:hypothetical protein